MVVVVELLEGRLTNGKVEGEITLHYYMPEA